MELFPYQKKASEWLASKPKAYLAAKMGLGKTAITIRALEQSDSYPALIICPKIAIGHWKREIDKWALFKSSYFEVMSYEQAVKMVKTTKIEKRPRYLAIVFDEAHYLKNSQAQRTKLLILNKNSLASNGAKLYFLSGTPVPNNVSELWPIGRVLGAWTENYSDFISRYCVIETLWLGGSRPVSKIAGTKRDKLPELRKRLGDYFLGVNYEEAEIDLPEICLSTFELDGKIDREIGELEEQIAPNLERLLMADNAIIGIQAMANSISTLRRLHALQKVDGAVELISNELANGDYEKLIVFGHHVEAMETLQEKLKEKKINSVLVHGGIDHKTREESIRKFQSDPDVKVYIGGILSSGVAINLHAANQVLFLEQSYVPGENAQAIARSARIGQKNKTVFVRILTLLDSGIDTRINEILFRKLQDIETFERCDK